MPQQRHWLYYWLPAFLWLGMIAMFSTREFAASNTGGVLEWLLHAFHVTMTPRRFELLHGLVRKSAHFTAYGFLSALLFRAWRMGFTQARWRWTWAILALLGAFVTASGDEFHQHFTPGRTGVFSDVELDMMGATFAQLMIVAWTAGRRRV